jgi:hypothetical protein
MLANPRIGQRVQVWYRKSLAAEMPLHGKVGTVAIRIPNGRIKNHGVVIDGKLYAIPCGNLRQISQEPER